MGVAVFRIKVHGNILTVVIFGIFIGYPIYIEAISLRYLQKDWALILGQRLWQLIGGISHIFNVVDQGSQVFLRSNKSTILSKLGADSVAIHFPRFSLPIKEWKPHSSVRESELTHSMCWWAVKVDLLHVETYYP